MRKTSSLQTRWIYHITSASNFSLWMSNQRSSWLRSWKVGSFGIRNASKLQLPRPKKTRLQLLGLRKLLLCFSAIRTGNLSHLVGGAQWFRFRHKGPLALWSTQSATAVRYAAQRHACLSDCKAI